MIDEKAKVELCQIEFSAPSLKMIFKATPERTKKLIDYMLTESAEASREVQELANKSQ